MDNEKNLLTKHAMRTGNEIGNFSLKSNIFNYRQIVKYA
jgi:hypothetical protein